MGVSWGWRISCDHEGCPVQVDKWSGPPRGGYNNGPPSLGPGGVQYNGAVRYWFWWRSGPPHQHRSFCPAHNEGAKAWVEAVLSWERKKEQMVADLVAARETTWRERLSDWVEGGGVYATRKADRAKRHALSPEIRAAVKEWLKSNPKPKAPWLT